MGTFANAFKSPVPITLRDREFYLSPIDQSDLGKLELYLQYRDYNILRESDSPTDLLDRVFEKCSQNPVDFFSISEAEFQKLDFICEWIFLSLRHHHSDITRAELKELLSFQEMENILRQVMDVSGMSNTSTDDKPSKKKPSRSRKNNNVKTSAK